MELSVADRQRQQKRDGLSRLLLLTSRDSGATWSESAISEDTYMTFEEPIPLWLSADAAGNAFVTYKRGYNTRYGHQVCYRPSADAGRTWGGEKVLLGYGGWTRGIKVDGGGNPASSELDMYMRYLSRTVFLFSSDRGQSFRKTAIDESRLISDIFFPDATTTALVYGGRFRRLAEGGSRLYRVSTYTDRNVYDCAAFHDPPQRFYVLWQEAVSSTQATMKTLPKSLSPERRNRRRSVGSVKKAPKTVSLPSRTSRRWARMARMVTTSGMTTNR